MSNSININRLVNVTNQVISPQSTNVNLIANVLSDSPLLPNDLNRTKYFYNVTDVQNYFGLLSDEAVWATIYFKGYKNATLVPPALLFSKYVLNDSPAFAISPTINNAAQIPAIYAAIKLLPKPTTAVNRFVITVGSVTYTLTSNTLDFTPSTVKSFQDIVNTLSAALTTALTGLTASLLPGTNNIIINTPTGNNVISYPTGPVADLLDLSQAFGGNISQGVLAQSPAQNMDTIVNLNNSFFAITYIERLYASLANGDVPIPSAPATGYPISVGVAQWLKTQTAGNFAFIPFETIPVDPITGIIQTAPTSTFPYQMLPNQLSPVFVSNGLGAYNQTLNKVIFNAPIHIEGGNLLTPNAATTTTDIGVYTAFISGACASVNFSLTRISLAGKSQDGLAPNVLVTTNYDILIANGYNVYGVFNANVQTFNLSESGSIGGPYTSLGQYLSAAWFVLQEQIVIANLIGSAPFLDYTNDTVSQVSAVLGNLIDACKRNKIIQVGNTFSQDELAQVIQITGNPQSGQQLTQFGYILYFPPISAQTRANQKAFPVYLFYSNGGEVTTFQINNIYVS